MIHKEDIVIRDINKDFVEVYTFEEDSPSFMFNYIEVSFFLFGVDCNVKIHENLKSEDEIQSKIAGFFNTKSKSL